MHELSVVTGILNTALKVLAENDMEKIFSLTLELGAMNDYEEEWLQKYFSQLSKDTPADGAKLIVRHMPFMFRCRECGYEFVFDVKGNDDCRCAKCNSEKFDMTSGRQFDIVSMEAQ